MTARANWTAWTTWSSNAREPFAGNGDFWRSVAASVDALLAFVIAVVAVLIAGSWGGVAFALPAVLLVRAAVAGRRSQRETRPRFAEPAAWRQAEREAVAAVFVSALVRRRWPFRR